MKETLNAYFKRKEIGVMTEEMPQITSGTETTK